MNLRTIRPTDDPTLQHLIRTVMTEFGLTAEGYSIHDPEVQAMHANYRPPRARYYVLESEDGEVMGGGGIAPLSGGSPDVCELKKMYFYPEARGHGWGRRLIHQLLDDARSLGYQTCYLETVDALEIATKLYLKIGFNRLNAPLGDTGHCHCNGWYAMDL